MTDGRAISARMRPNGAESYFLAGQRCFYAAGEDRDYVSAYNWYAEAAKRGHAHAAYLCGYMLQTGMAGKVNLRKGNNFLKKAVAKNDVQAILRLARNCFYGLGFQRNYKKAFDLWKKGTRLGCPEAEYYLGLCYQKGISVRPNAEKAKKHVSNACKNGFAFGELQ